MMQCREANTACQPITDDLVECHPPEALTVPLEQQDPGIIAAGRRYLPLVIVVTLLSMILAGGVGLLLGRNATATATVALSTSDARNLLTPGLQGEASLSRYITGRALFMTSDSVLNAVVKELNDGTSLAELRKNVSADAVSDSAAVIVTVTDPSLTDAVRIANVVTEQYRVATLQQVTAITKAAKDNVSRQIADIEKRLNAKPGDGESQALAQTLSTLLAQSAQLDTDQAVFGDGVTFVQAANVSDNPKRTIPLLPLAIGGLLGLSLGLTLAWFRASRNPRVDEPDQAAAVFGVPLLGTVPKVATNKPSGGAQLALAYREILAPNVAGLTSGVLLISSASPQAGTTTTTVGLGSAAGAEGLRVLLVDADTASGGLTQSLGISNTDPGFIEAVSLSGFDVTSKVRSTTLAAGVTVDVLPVGSTGARPLTGATAEAGLSAAALRAFVQSTAALYDTVIIDAGSATSGYVASALAGAVDGVLIVARRREDIGALQEAQRVMSLSHAPVLGCIVTFVDRGAHPTSQR